MSSDTDALIEEQLRWYIRPLPAEPRWPEPGKSEEYATFMGDKLVFHRTRVGRRMFGLLPHGATKWDITPIDEPAMFPDPKHREFLEKLANRALYQCQNPTQMCGPYSALTGLALGILQLCEAERQRRELEQVEAQVFMRDDGGVS